MEGVFAGTSAAMSDHTVEVYACSNGFSRMVGDVSIAFPRCGGRRGLLHRRAGRLPPAGRVHQDARAQVRVAHEEGPLRQARGCSALAAVCLRDPGEVGR
eukprot:735734-Alexandrium_andersonii.AAC.1